ncbi:MAG: tRNA (adenosine(37)-N6)-dimethylallyltransferase MiaA [Luteitalea sp.]|nr:tRNA (adenosine(37)-N6)-dimethylallyltransferase MiaA [Luteitalea sp.]
MRAPKLDSNASSFGFSRVLARPLHWFPFPCRGPPVHSSLVCSSCSRPSSSWPQYDGGGSSKRTGVQVPGGGVLGAGGAGVPRAGVPGAGCRGAPLLVAILGATATGKSRLALDLAERHGGEIISCDSTAVYRYFDIGTDKVPVSERRGVPHHLIDIVEPTETYSAAQFARDAARVVRDITERGKLPILVGGTGFYYRALTRGLFEGAGRDDALRARLHAMSARRRTPFLHRMVARLDPLSATRIMPRDEKRLVRALEVYFLTGQPLSAHFAETRSALPGYRILALALRLPSALVAERVTRRVNEQFARGVVGEVRRLLAAAVPEEAHPFSGLVYRQILELLHGVRDEEATRALIVRENKRYARRQLIWFRKEPNLHWLDGAGEWPTTLAAAELALDTWRLAHGTDS